MKLTGMSAQREPGGSPTVREGSSATNSSLSDSASVELRSRLAEARSALGLPAASYTDPSLAVGMTVKAAHIQELRQRVTETVTANLSIPVDVQANLLARSIHYSSLDLNNQPASLVSYARPS
jgi:hypothetical protein